MKNRLLLLQDVANVGRKGDLVQVKPGFARNFLVPQKHAIVADASVVKIQARLKEERSKQAIIDQQASEEVKVRLASLVVTTDAKVDPDGHMYGSINAHGIVDLLEEEGIKIDRRMVLIDQPFKRMGTYTVNLKLKEGVEAHFNLKIEAEEGSILAKPKPVKEEKVDVEVENNQEQE